MPSLGRDGFVRLNRSDRSPPPPPAPGHNFQHTMSATPGVPAGPPPPRHILPVDMQCPPLPPINDVSHHLRSEADKAEDLSEYRIIRFEKAVDKNALDDHGRSRWSGWERAIRTEERSISKQEAANKIRRLNRESVPVIDKKSSLGAELKQQIDSTLEFLLRQEPAPLTYTWKLAQLDHQLRRIEPFPQALTYQYIDRGHRRTTHHTSSKKTRRRSSSHSRRLPKKKKAYERLSLTAYFKRVPRQGVDIDRLWDHNFGQDMYHPYAINQQVFPPRPQVVHQAPGPQPGKAQGRPPGPRPGSKGHPMNKGPGKYKPNKQGRDDSCSSSCSSGSESGSGRDTPPSSVEGQRGRGRSPPHGVKNSRPPNIKMVDHRDGPPVSMPVPRTPRPPPYPDSDSPSSHIIERVKHAAFQQGRFAERREAREVEESIIRENQRRRRSPHIIQAEFEPSPVHRRSSPRFAHGDYVASSPGFPTARPLRRGDEHIPRFASLSLDDSDDDLSRPRPRESTYRPTYGSVLSEDHFERRSRRESPSSTSYTYSDDVVRRPPRYIEISNPRIRRPGDYR